MKKRLYYVLIPVYVLTVIFILYINGVLTGSAGFSVNLLINVGFLLLIGVLFYISIMSFNGLCQCMEELSAIAGQMQDEYVNAGEKNLWSVYKGRKELFKNQMLNQAFEKYCLRMKTYESKRGYKEVCDIAEYINEDLLDRISKNHFNSAMPGTLTGLGILGTFLGLSMGLASFSGENLFTITDNVGPLLEGMKVAFHTSVYGIFFSLIFGFVYKGLVAEAYEKLEHFQNTFRQFAAPKAQAKEEDTAAMVIYQANTANALKQILELLKGNAKEQTEGLERIVNQFTAQMTDTMSCDFEKLGISLKNAAEAQAVAVNNSKELLETVETLVVVNRGLQEVMNGILERQEVFAKELAAQKQELSAACGKMSDEISSELYAFEQMRNLYE